MPTTISGVRKAAILLTALGEEASAKLLMELDDDDLMRVTREIAKIDHVIAAESEAVLEECLALTIAQQHAISGGNAYARNLLTEAYGEDAARKYMEALEETLGLSTDFDFLKKADPSLLAKLIYGEHPQTIALVLGRLSPPQAAAILASLPPETRPEVVLRMATSEPSSTDVAGKIARLLGKKLKSLSDGPRQSAGGVRAVADMLNRLDAGTSKEILSEMGDRDTKLGDTIESLMFLFEDLISLNKFGLTALLAKVDRKQLAMALKGTSQPLRDHCLSTMSTRAQDMLREEIEALGPVRIAEVVAAQQNIIGVARSLQQAGEITIGDAVSDQYVH